MANRLKHLSSATAGNTPPLGVAVDRGRLAFNVTDRKIWGYDASGTARLIASLTTDHAATSTYRVGDLAVQNGVLYRCTANIPPKAFAAGDWAAVSDFRAELLYRAPTQIAQARMTMAATAVGLRVRAHASQSTALTAWENSSGTIVSDIRADGYPGAAFGRSVFRVDQVAHGFTAVGQPVRFNGTNWVLADASVAGGAALGVVHKVLSANAVEIQTAGRIDGLQNGAFEGGVRTANTRYYLSVANPGQLTPTAPPDANDENVVLHTLTTDAAVLNLQVPVGSGGAASGSTPVVTQTPNPFTAVGQVAAIGPSGWERANPGTTVPVGIISATAGNDFAVTLSGAVAGIVAGAAASFPLVAGTVYYSSATGLLTATAPTGSALGAGPVLVATSGSSGIVIAGQATPNALRASQNLADLASVSVALTNLGLNDVVRTSRTLTAGTGLTGGGNLTANRTFALNAASIASLGLADTAVQPARAINTGAGLTGGGNLSANRTISLTGQALALHNFTNTGIMVRTGDAAYTTRAFAAGDGLSVTNGSGLSGNPSYAVDSSVVRTSRTLTAGDGLTGGGNLGANRTFAVDGTVVRTSGDQQITGQTTLSNGRFDIAYLERTTGGVPDARWVASIFQSGALEFRNPDSGAGRYRFFDDGGVSESIHSVLRREAGDARYAPITFSPNQQQVKVALNADNAPPIFACRAWVNFNGNNGSIRNSGNVSSVTRNGEGRYTINFSTNMPGGGDYSVVASGKNSTGQDTANNRFMGAFNYTNSSVQLNSQSDSSTFQDAAFISAAVFR